MRPPMDELGEKFDWGMRWEADRIAWALSLKVGLDFMGVVRRSWGFRWDRSFLNLYQRTNAVYFFRAVLSYITNASFPTPLPMFLSNQVW